MTKSKPGFTRAQHFEIGEQLRRARAILMAAYMDISNAYPVAGTEAIAAGRAVKALDKLRGRLDSAICRETAADDQEALRAYYGSERR